MQTSFYKLVFKIELCLKFKIISELSKFILIIFIYCRFIISLVIESSTNIYYHIQNVYTLM